MSGSIIGVDFGLFPDNHNMPVRFDIAGIKFRANDPTKRFFVNNTEGVLGLQFSDEGVTVQFPVGTSLVRLRAGGFHGPLTVQGRNVAGQLVYNQQLLPQNAFVVLNLPELNMKEVQLLRGGAEGVLASVAFRC